MKQMHYKARIIILLVIWVLCFAAMGLGTTYYGYVRSMETTNQTVRGSLNKINETLPSLIDNEIEVRDAYEDMHENMAELIPILQEHGLEEDVPSEAHMKTYAQLFGADYMAIRDADGKPLVSYGKFREEEQVDEEEASAVDFDSEQGMRAWFTSGISMITEEDDFTTFEGFLPNGNILVYQISNAATRKIEDQVFSWRAILGNMTLPGNVQIVVISQTDETILVHPDEDMIGKSYEDLGAASKEDFLARYQKPDKDGIAWHKSLTQILTEMVNNNVGRWVGLQLEGLGSGYIDCDGVYVMCMVPQSTVLAYLTQQRGVLMIFTIGSLLALAYVWLRFRQQKRLVQASADQAKAGAASADAAKGESTARISDTARSASTGTAAASLRGGSSVGAAGGAAANAGGSSAGAAGTEDPGGPNASDDAAEAAGADGDDMESYTSTRFGFIYERAWSRRLALCCVIVLLGSGCLATHVELLSNSAYVKIQQEQTAALTKSMSKENEKHRQMLDDWYNDNTARLAAVIKYTISRDDSLQTRSALKEIAEKFQVAQVSIFRENGKMKATSSNYDHVDLFANPSSRESRTFLPLLEGMEQNASTPITNLDGDAGQTEDEEDGDAAAATSAANGKEGQYALAAMEDMAFAGISIRNGQDLTDGCLGIALEPLRPLWGSKGSLSMENDTFATILELANVDTNEDESLPSLSQMKLVFAMLGYLLVCLVLFWCLGTLRWTGWKNLKFLQKLHKSDRPKSRKKDKKERKKDLKKEGKKDRKKERKQRQKKGLRRRRKGGAEEEPAIEAGAEGLLAAAAADPDGALAAGVSEADVLMAREAAATGPGIGASEGVPTEEPPRSEAAAVPVEALRAVSEIRATLSPFAMEDETAEDEPDFGTYGDEDADEEKAESSAGQVSAEEQEDMFYSIFGRQRDHFFKQRWNIDNTPIRERSPERQLFFILRCLLVVLFLQIVMIFLTRGEALSETSMFRDMVTGGWEEGVNLYAITGSEMIIITAIVLCMALHRLIYFAARFSTPRGETVCHLVYSIVTYAAVLVALYYCLSLFGVHTRTMLAGAGILGIVISFGAQNTIADILSGMFLIFEDVIHVGDFVKVGDTMGIINNIGVRMTKLQSFGTTISINNADLKAMQNMSAGDGRVSCYLTLDCMENLTRVEEIIERELPGINDRITATGYTTSDIWYSGVTNFNKDGLVLRFDVFCISYRFARVTRALNGELIKMCQRNGIHMAFDRTLLVQGKRKDAETGGVKDGAATDGLRK